MDPRGPVPNVGLTQVILDQFPEDYVGYACDVGASDGIQCNSTYLLEALRWTVLSVEANPDFTLSLNHHRAFVENCACAQAGGVGKFTVNLDNPEAYSALRMTTRTDLKELPTRTKEITVPVCTVDELLRKWEFPRLDVLCIDTEGTELDVLRGSDLGHWLPRVLVVEECDVNTPELDDFLKPHGYKKVWRLVHNDMYMRV